jgi:O-acetyl-ADP-ribose deacetylase (regulator of RNase III)
MDNLTVYLRSFDTTLVSAWQKYFVDRPEVIPSVGNVFDIRADVIVSPANGFGFMDGGIDRVYSEHFGWHIQDRLRDLLRREYDGELPVGLAVLIETDDPAIPFMVSAPTMHVPNSVKDTLNAYLAFRAALRVVQRKNAESPGAIKTLLCPGMATGTGEMLPEICAKQMHAAYIQVTSGNGWYPQSVNAAILEHYRLLRVDD